MHRRPYPHMMVTGSLYDRRVNYWEPAKFVAKMRAVKTDNRMLVLKVRTLSSLGGQSSPFWGSMLLRAHKGSVTV